MSFIWASPNSKRDDPFVTHTVYGDKSRRRGEGFEGEMTQEQMLSNAYKAIYGDEPSMTARENYDYSLLSLMADRKHRQQIDVAEGRRKKIDSDRKLAADVLGGNKKNKFEKLRKSFVQFERERAELDPEMLIALEAVQRLALDLVEATVVPFGVPFYAYD